MGAPPTVGANTGINAGTISTAGSLASVSKVASGLLRSIGLTIATEAQHVAGSGGVMLGLRLGFETIDVGTISTAGSSPSRENVASGEETVGPNTGIKSGTISTAGSLALVSNVASGLI